MGKDLHEQIARNISTMKAEYAKRGALIEFLDMKLAQAYQVIGSAVPLGNDIPEIPDAEWVRALDYFASDKYDEEFLPWPK